MDKLSQGLAWKGGAMIVVLLLLFIILWSNLNNMISEMCENTVMKQIASPDKSLNAVVYQRDCGSGSGISTNVSVLPSSNPFPERKGNLFIVEGREATGMMHVKWTGLQKLTIVYKGQSKVLKTNNQMQDVTVEYRTTGINIPGKNDKVHQ